MKTAMQRTIACVFNDLAVIFQEFNAKQMAKKVKSHISISNFVFLWLDGIFEELD